MKKMFFILLTTTLPQFCFSQILKEMPKLDNPKLIIPEEKMPLFSQDKILKTDKKIKYFILVKKPESPELYTILVKKPVENLEKILIAKPK